MSTSSAATLLTLRIPFFDAALRKASTPQFQDRPVVVVTSLRPLGRVLSACPLARARGVREDMPYPAARVGCPDALFFPPDRQLARETMETLVGEAGAYSPLVEAAGSGSVVLDIHGTEKLWGDGCTVAKLLRRTIGAKLNLPTAAGLARHRAWSMLASRVAGDDSVYYASPGEEDAFLGDIPADWVEGLLPRTRTRFAEMNVRTLGDLRAFSRLELTRQFGSGCGEKLWVVLHPPDWEPVAVLSGGAHHASPEDRLRFEAALAEPTVDGEKLRVVARNLAAQAATSLRKRRLGAARLRLGLLHTDGAVKFAAQRTGGYVQLETVLMETAERLVARVFRRRVRVLRMWLEAEKLAAPARQGVLFGEPAAVIAGSKRLEDAVDHIRARFGDDALTPAALLIDQPPAPLRLFPERTLLESG